MIKIGQIVQLDDDKEYMVLNKMSLHSINYLYLITITKPTEILIVTETKQNDEIVFEEIKDNDELDYVLSQFVLNSELTDEID